MSLMIVGGSSGSGKSTSLRNCDPATTFIIQTIPKPLPFRGWKKKFPMLDTKTFEGNRYVLMKEYKSEEANASKTYQAVAKRAKTILKKIREKRPEIELIIFDDTQYIMSYEYMARAREGGFDRFASIAQNFHSVVEFASKIAIEVDVVFLHHTDHEIVGDKVQKKLKTIGKLVDNVITFEGLFTIVLMAKILEGEEGSEHVFETNSDGSSTAKSPMGMFEKPIIPNDLVEVLKVVHEYDDAE